ncbi:MAG: hypothetical protein KF749_02925 [Bacteroidetes bacterium]|nr:hypothetical protein [Bacteroidota bacterium]MCW5896769.1 hypothetical protein [Bacteroidota bacterium]
MARFLGMLNKSQISREPYLTELTEYLPNILSNADLTGCDPEDVLLVHNDIVVFRDYGIDINEMKLAAATLFAYAGELAKAMSVLQEGNLQPWVTEIQTNPSIPPLNRLRQAVERSTDEKTTSALKKIEAIWVKAISGANRSVVIPVVEHSLVRVHSEQGDSGLRRVSVEVLGESRNGKDQIYADVAVFGADTTSADIIAAPIAATRNLITEKYPEAAKHFVAGRLVFEDEHAMHEGLSANLGIAALTCCEILRSSMQREYYRIRPTVALTGAIDEKGYVQEVKSATLPEKVKAAFFSWIEFLVLPKLQLAAAEEALCSLTEKYPHRTLTLVGVTDLREVFFDRRLSDLVRVPIHKHAARRLWKWRFPIAAAAFLFLVVAFWRLWYGPLDKNPVGFEFKGGMLFIKNKQGQTVDEIWVGETIVKGSKDDDLRRPRTVFVGFADVDHNGVSEVIWVASVFPTRIDCKSIGTKTPLWSKVMEKTLHFPHNTDVKGKELVPNALIAGDFDNDGSYEVIISGRLSPFFPGIVMKLDAATGKELAHYVHIGHLVDILPWDLDGDGITEILLCGTNNALRSACVVVLDPRFMSGHSPLTAEYQVDGYDAGTERSYIRIPRTVVGEVFGLRNKYNWARRIFYEDSSTFVLRLEDADIDGERQEDRLSPSLWAYFKTDLTVTGIGTGDDFDLVYEDLMEKGRIRRLDRGLYMSEYQKSIRYWDGETWHDKPVSNKRYVEALKSVK